MPTIPTGKLERELRALYLRWIQGVSMDSTDLQDKMVGFTRSAQSLIEREGGRVALLGALGDFPAPKSLELSPHIGTVYSAMQQAAVQASITAGLNSRDAAQQMFRAGMDKSYRKLERLARTETVSAYWKNAWDSIADLPALVMVWGSEDGARTCAWCRERDGMVMEDSNLRDHPNGRCTPIPMLRSLVEYRGSVRRDGEIYFDPRWATPVKKIVTVDDIIGSNRQAKTIMGRNTSPEVKAKDIAYLVSKGKLSEANADVLRAALKTTVPVKTPVKKVPIAAAKTEAQFEARQVWPAATQEDLPFSPVFFQYERTMQRYIRLAYEDINGALRRGFVSEKMQEIITDMRKVTASRTTKDVTLTRQMADVGFLGRQFKGKDFDPSLLVGKSFQDKGFVSTSYAGAERLVEFDDLPVKMEILAPKGTRGSLVNNDREREFLLDAGNQFTIIDAVRDAEGILRLRVALTQEAR